MSIKEDAEALGRMLAKSNAAPLNQEASVQPEPAGRVATLQEVQREFTVDSAGNVNYDLGNGTHVQVHYTSFRVASDGYLYLHATALM